MVRILSYVYVEDFPGLGRRDINFDGNYEIKLEGRNLLIRQRDLLGDEFYSRKGDIHISCAVGSNGAGKTSIARLFYELSLSCGRHKVVLVVREGKKFTPYQSGINGMTVSLFDNQGGIVEDIIHLTSEVLSQDFVFGYFSPIYNTQHFVSNENSIFVDVSTTYLLRNTQEGEENLAAYGLDRYQIFDASDTMRALAFVERIHNSDYENCGFTLPIRVPDFVLLGPNERELKIIRDEYKRHLDVVLQDATGAQKAIAKRGMSLRESLLAEPRNDYCLKVLNICGLYKKASICEKFIICFAVVNSYDSHLGLKLVPREQDTDMLDAAIAFAQGRDISAEIKDNQHLRPLGLLINALQSLLKWGSKADDSDLIRFSFTESELNEHEQAQGDLPMGRSPKFESFCSFILSYKGLKDKTDFVSISTYPYISSGEWHIIIMFSRLMHLMRRIRNRAVTVFLDEVETSLHPDWQRKLVKCVIWFFEHFNNGNSVHVVFFTHSPILLSDIPKGNVVFLTRDRITANGEVSYTREQMDNDVLKIANTFGSDIFDLYSKSFFLPDGTVGEFAQDKLSALTKKLLAAFNDGEKLLLSEDDKRLMRIVGDEYLRKYFITVMKIAEQRFQR